MKLLDSGKGEWYGFPGLKIQLVDAKLLTDPSAVHHPPEIIALPVLQEGGIFKIRQTEVFP